MSLLEIVAELLEYPSKWRREEVLVKLERLNSPHKQELMKFLEDTSRYGELDLEEIYVNTFDNNDRLTLNVTYYITGEERDRVKPARRGSLLVLLKERVGNVEGELPDYLPFLLRYLDVHDDTDLKELLRRPLSLLRERLRESDSIFYPLLNVAYLELYGGEET